MLASSSRSHFFKHLSCTFCLPFLGLPLGLVPLPPPLSPFTHFSASSRISSKARQPWNLSSIVAGISTSSSSTFSPETSNTDISNSSYLSVLILCRKDVADMLSDALLCFGASSASMDEQDCYEGSDEICISSIFTEHEDVGICISHAVDSIGLKEMPSYEVIMGEQCDWIKKTQVEGVESREGFAIKITEHCKRGLRSSLWVPEEAIQWLENMLKDFMDTTGYMFRKLQCRRDTIIGEKRSNAGGEFIVIQSYLRSGTGGRIFIPKGSRNSGWSALLKVLGTLQLNSDPSKELLSDMASSRVGKVDSLRVEPGNLNAISSKKTTIASWWSIWMRECSTGGLMPWFVLSGGPNRRMTGRSLVAKGSEDGQYVTNGRIVVADISDMSLKKDMPSPSSFPTHSSHPGVDRVGMESFLPVEVAEGLWIVPEWRTPPDVQATNIILNPGLAFGTGEHPSTKLCLLLLHGLIKGGELFLDYGTGSGILGIAALKFGAALSVGVDVDPKAITSARQNAGLNNIGPEKMRLCLVQDKASPPTRDGRTSVDAEEQSSHGMKVIAETDKYDIVIANILLNPLIELADHIAAYAKPGAVVGVSGILSEQLPKIIERYSQFLEGISVSEMDGWACVSGTKKEIY
ncbi:hypothetical protein HHK36_003668 [Tetracentron sinense]|uniref:ETFB lysine methyltransferase n=1 Tax=Tetracentron sinense TaxID=13715 RepID=A0A834ZP48_TETSI|nr:hypothetical protein HHK36_003668 [Tetracentron sinense]